MARIILEPSESFEHYHANPSETIHVSGKVEITLSEESRLMKLGEIIRVPKDTKHIVTNRGETIAEVACVHLKN